MYETVEFDYIDADTRYPDAMAEIERQIKASKARFKGKLISEYPVNQFRIFYSCMLVMNNSIKGSDFMRKLVSGELQRETESRKQEELGKSREQKYADAFSRIRSGTINMAVRGSDRRFSAQLPEVPAEVVTLVKSNVDRDIAEKERISNLTEDQRRNEVIDLLNQLRGTPGFVAVSMSMESDRLSSATSASFAGGTTNNDVHMQKGGAHDEKPKPKLNRFESIEV